jgi:hypothetical protein
MMNYFQVQCLICYQLCVRKDSLSKFWYIGFNVLNHCFSIVCIN